MVSEQTDKWKLYYDKTAGQSPHRTVRRALALFASERENLDGLRGLDLGCGAGRDSIEMARRGFSVFAIDREPEALEMLLQGAADAGQETIAAIEADFIRLPFPKVDLVVSSFALPHCLPTEFPEIWDRALKSLNPGGRVAVHIYGPKDSWASRSDMTILTREQLMNYLFDLDIEMLDEEETDAVTPKGDPKHWHLFHVVAKIRDPVPAHSTEHDEKDVSDGFENPSSETSD